MDKKLRNILILAGVLILLCIGYAVAGLIFKEDIPEETTAPETTVEESTFLGVTEDGLTTLAYTYDADGDGVAETWSYTRSADGETWHWDTDPAVPLGSSAFYGYSSTLYGIKVISTLTEVTEAELVEYGLDQPLKTVTFTDKVYGLQSFCIGAYNTYNGTYCAYRNGDKTTVYLLDGAFYTEFERAVESFVYHDDLPAFKPEGLKSLTLAQGDYTVTLTRETDGEGKAVWHRSVNGEAIVQVAPDLASSLELLVGDMDYLACLSVRKADFPEYGLHENTTTMTVAYEKTVSGVTEAFTFTLTLGSTDKYGYYYANPEGTTLTMLLGGSVFHKAMTSTTPISPQATPPKPTRPQADTPFTHPHTAPNGHGGAFRMNVAFFLIPKSHVTYLTEGCSFRHGMEKLRRHGYTAIPVVGKDGRYLGSISEGDFLWNIMSMGSLDLNELEKACIDEIVSDRTPPVRVTTSVEELLDRVLDQNFVPVVDDRDVFVGIVTRRSVLAYLMSNGAEAECC